MNNVSLANPKSKKYLKSKSINLHKDKKRASMKFSKMQSDNNIIAQVLKSDILPNSYDKVFEAGMVNAIILVFVCFLIKTIIRDLL